MRVSGIFNKNQDFCEKLQLVSVKRQKIVSWRVSALLAHFSLIFRFSSLSWERFLPLHTLAGVRARASSRFALKKYFACHCICRVVCLFFELSRQTSYHVYRSMRATRVRNSMMNGYRKNPLAVDGLLMLCFCLALAWTRGRFLLLLMPHWVLLCCVVGLALLSCWLIESVRTRRLRSILSVLLLLLAFAFR